MGKHLPGHIGGSLGGSLMHSRGRRRRERQQRRREEQHWASLAGPVEVRKVGDHGGPTEDDDTEDRED